MKFKIDKNWLRDEMQYQLDLLSTYIKYMNEDIHFTPIRPISLNVDNSIRGIYYLVHIPTNSVMYIGQGNINERITQHRRVFLNGGIKLTYVSNKGMASVVDSPAGRKMHGYNPNIDNWGVCWVQLDIEYLKLIESKLISMYNPPFNKKVLPKQKLKVNPTNKFW